MSTIGITHSWHLHPTLREVGPAGRDLYLLLCCLARKQGRDAIETDEDVLREYAQQTPAKVMQLLTELHDLELVGLEADGTINVGGFGRFWS